MKEHEICGMKFSENGWVVKEDKWDPKQQAVGETQFTLGNGYMGSRGVLEEIPYDATAGTFIAGIYDRIGSQVPEIVNMPNPFQFRFDVAGEKVGVIAMDVVKHLRALDMKRGLLFRNSVFKTAYKKRIAYQSMRFISMDDPHLLVMRVEITPLDEALTLNVQSGADVDVFNKGILTEGRKKHFQITEVSSSGGIDYLTIKTFERECFVVYAARLKMCKGGRCVVKSRESFRFKVKKGETITFIKTISIYTSRDAKEHAIKGMATRSLKKADKLTVEKLVKRHEAAWQDRWDRANVEIEGDKEVERALRFNIYHLLIAGSLNDDQVSIGARTLSGEGYRGHVFWDTEIFMLPFFIYIDPRVAKNLLMYRYHRLKAAKELAQAKGYKGALFPWESAGTGQEATPMWHKDFDGSVIRIVTMEQEQHIVADVAFGVYQYFQATGDKEFWYKYGLEIIFETAMFWTSRAEYNAKKKRYEYHHVMGPDEFHADINNNAYTNIMAAWNIKTAIDEYENLNKDRPTIFKMLKKKIGITDAEIKKWRSVCHDIYVPINKKKKIIEEFDGYCNLKDIKITQLDEKLMPMFPANLDLSQIGTTQLVKQADVIMLFHLLRSKFSLEDLRRNYKYYEKRTLHKSSLSPSIHAIVGLEAKDQDRAFHYFFGTVTADLFNIHGNTREGVHAASLGGAWQAFFFGFAGVRDFGHELVINPKLPKRWKKIKVTFMWKNCKFKAQISNKEVELKIEGVKRGQILTLHVFDNILDVERDETCVFSRSH